MNTLINLIEDYWLIITMFLLAVIATLSLWPAEHLPQVPGSDKTHHFIAYGALILPVALRSRSERRVFLSINLLLCTAMATAFEVPTMTTIFFPRVIAVYNKFRCSII